MNLWLKKSKTLGGPESSPTCAQGSRFARCPSVWSCATDLPQSLPGGARGGLSSLRARWSTYIFYIVPKVHSHRPDSWRCKTAITGLGPLEDSRRNDVFPLRVVRVESVIGVAPGGPHCRGVSRPSLGVPGGTRCLIFSWGHHYRCCPCCSVADLADLCTGEPGLPVVLRCGAFHPRCGATVSK